MNNTSIPLPMDQEIGQPVSEAARPWSNILRTPSADLLELWHLGVAGVPLMQYLRWAEEADLFVVMADRDTITPDEIVSKTPLTLRGANAMLRLLCALGFATREGNAYRLGDVCREYLDRRRPCYVGEALYGMLHQKFPPRLRKGERVRHFSRATGSLWDKLRFRRSRNQWGRPERLLHQHSRNFPAAIVAARSGHFDGITHLADIGGGSGAFAIPLVLDDPRLRITLVELPRALPHIAKFLEPYPIQDRITLLGLNVHEKNWPVRGCDAALFGNFLHFCGDDECVHLLQESFRLLPSGGRVLIHEMLWNEQGDGPLVTALWNFWITSISAGRQRTREELNGLLQTAGFGPATFTETLGGFSLAVAFKD